MTILQICAYAAPYEGNFIQSLKFLNVELNNKGHKVIYAFPESAKKLNWCTELEKYTEVFYLPLAKARLLPKTYKKLLSIYKKYSDLEIIHCHFELYDVPVCLTAPKNVKVFWHLHDALENYSDLKNKIVHKMQYGILHKNVKLLSVSQKHMEYAIRLGFPEKNAEYVPNGLNLDRIKISDFNKEFDFLIFGWEFERKGVDLCIEAMQLLNENIKIAVVGNENTNEIIEKRYGKIKNITVLKPVSNINELYSKCKCFLHISRAEGLSYALLEAVYAGLPVICSDIRENQFANQFETVLMVKSENVIDIANGMKKIMNSFEIDIEKIQKVRKKIETEFSVACWVKNILDHYEVKNND